MIQLEKNHDPSKNKQMIDELLGNPLSVDETMKETQAFFDEIKIDPVANPVLDRPSSVAEKALSLYRMPYSIPDPQDYKWASNETELYPEWKDKLDQEYV